MAKNTIYTIGHSTRSIEEFIAMLKSFNIELLVDVRHFPGSRRYPHFNKDELQKHLLDNGFDYSHEVSLGGRRKADPESPYTSWRHPAFRGYADYMQTDEFKHGISRLKETASGKITTIMCSEAVWWRCHRPMIADFLKAEGWEVLHIMAEGQSSEHPYTAPAKVVDGKLFY